MAKVIGHAKAKPAEPRFRAIEDALEARQLLEHAELTRSSVDVQFASIPLRFTGRIGEPTSPNGVTVILPKNLDKASLETLGIGPLERDCMLVIFVRGLLLLGVRASKVEAEKGQIRLCPPWKLFAIQRRKEGRFDIPAGYDVNIRVEAIEGGSRKVEKKILDVSGGGIGFQVVSAREAGLFRDGTILKNSMFRLDNHIVTADLVVRNRCPISPDRKVTGVKIGCSFARISPHDAEFIANWVASRLATF